MSIIESILYGLVSGLTDFLPVSSRAHQALMRYLFGAETRVPFQELLVHIGLLLSVFAGCREVVSSLHREQKAMSAARRRRTRSLDNRSYYDLRLLKTAAVPLIVGSLLYFATVRFEDDLLLLMAFWLCNGLILLVADHTSRGNRDSRTMSALDGIIMGVAGAASVLPGISRTGMVSAYASARGAESTNAAHWAVLLGIPAGLFAIVFDLVSVVSTGLGIGSFVGFAGCILSGIAAFSGGYVGISLLKMVLNQSGFSKFAFYSIGAALFSFVLYLIT